MIRDLLTLPDEIIERCSELSRDEAIEVAAHLLVERLGSAHMAALADYMRHVYPDHGSALPDALDGLIWQRCSVCGVRFSVSARQSETMCFSCGLDAEEGR